LGKVGRATSIGSRSAYPCTRSSAPTREKVYTKGKTVLQFTVNLCTFNPNDFSAELTEVKLSRSSVIVNEVEDVPDGTLLLTYNNGMTWRGKDVPDATGAMQFDTEIDERVKDEHKEKMRTLERLGRNMAMSRCCGMTWSIGSCIYCCHIRNLCCRVK
jgi:hypothetical protein